MIVDLFAGPGGWDEGLRMLGHEGEVVGLEWDQGACETRAAAGHKTIQADVAAYDPQSFQDVVGLIASPPCPAFSDAGKREGIQDVPRLLIHARRCRNGWVELSPPAVNPMAHPESRLVLEVLRWTWALRPKWIACEQVLQVLPFWRECAATLEAWGYRTWVGNLNSANYGVPQTRKRAILMASLDRKLSAPPGTHSDSKKGSLLFGLPWVSMADALGWDGVVGFPRVDDLGNSPDGYRERDWRTTDLPAGVVTEKARSWVRRSVLRTHQRPDKHVPAGEPKDYQERDVESPAPTLNGSIRSWVFDRPRVAQSDRTEDAVRITVEQAAVLQGFPPDYPFQGSRTKQFEQVGNAIPPPLAAAILGQLLD